MDFNQFLALDWVSMLQAALRTATPIVLAALGGILAERSGVINIALEGIMLVAAYAGFIVGVLTGSTWMGLAGALVCGALVAALHALLCIRYKTNQVISGVVINIFAAGLTGYFYRQFDINADVTTLSEINIPFLESIPVIGPILFQQRVLTYVMLILVIVVQVALFRTAWGLRTRAIGERPRAADTMGIKVNRMRYLNVILSGVLAGLAGAYLTLGSVGRFTPNMTGGRGFIGLAAMIFGNWTPAGALFASLLFTIPDAIAVKIQILGVQIPSQIVTLLPYVLTIVVLAGFGRRSRAPEALGKPYETQAR
jgi:simple sugar transport system permease protein